MKFSGNRFVALSLLPLATALILPLSSAASGDCHQSTLENATYNGIEEIPVTLSEGSWEGEPYAGGGASRPRVGLVEDVYFSGDLNADGSDEIVTLLWQSGGGTGSNTYLAVMSQRTDGLENIATALVGDRVKLRSGSIDAGKIRLEVLQAAETDAMCCPTELATRTWSLVDGQLEESEMDIEGPLSITTLEGSEWRLTRMDHGEATIDNANVTLLFSEDRIAGKSACNRYSAGIEDGQKPGEIKIGLAMSTKMACPEALMKIEMAYLDALMQVTGFSFYNGQLSLNGQGDDGNSFSLLFSPVEKATD